MVRSAATRRARGDPEVHVIDKALGSAGVSSSMSSTTGNPLKSTVNDGAKASRIRESWRVLLTAWCAIAIMMLAIGLGIYWEHDWRGSEPGTIDIVPPNADADDRRQVDEFLRWFHAHGGVSRKIDIAHFGPMGRGVLATEDVVEGETVLIVPKRIILCKDTIVAREGDATMRRKFAKLDDDELLTAFLVLEQRRGADSEWAPYLALLPRFDPTTAPETILSPLFFDTDDEVAALEDERMIAMAQSERQRARLGYRRFRRLFVPKSPTTTSTSMPPPTWDEYRWARFLVNSRAFSMRGRRYLVPYGDLYNGRPQPVARAHANGRHFLDYHRLGDKGIEILADRPTPRGLQAFEDYGDNDNYIYGLYHGFLMADNPFDCASVRLPSLAFDTTLRPVKLAILAHYGLESSPLVCLRGDVAVSAQDLEPAQRYARVYLMDAEELAFCGREAHYAHCFEPGTMTPAPLGAFRDLLRAAAEAQLAVLRIDEDDAGRSSDQRSPGHRHAARFRMSRRAILLQAKAQLDSPSRSADADTIVVDTSTKGEQDDDTTTPEPPKTAIARFEQWLGAQGLSINHVRLKYIGPEMGYGVVATRALAPGEIYLSVPARLVMDGASALRSRAIRRLLSATPRLLPNNQLLLLHLLVEKFDPDVAPGSPWGPYLDVLPSPAEGLPSPLFYDDDGPELALLAAATPDLHGQVVDYRRRVARGFETLRGRGVLLGPWLTLERYRWAQGILDTRSIWWGGQRHLVPLLDMVNCRELAPAHVPHHTVLDAEGRAAITRASWGFAPGDEVVENYGQPNAIYLLYHGFVLETNSHDCAQFTFALEPKKVGGGSKGGDDDNDEEQQRRHLIRALEALELFTWTPEICIRVGDDPGSRKKLDQLGRVALLAAHPELAERLEEVTEAEALEAAKKETTVRMERISRALESPAAADAPVIATFARQQRQLLQQVHDRLLDLQRVKEQ